MLSAIAWLPIDVSGFTPAWAVLFVGVFPVVLAAMLMLSREQRDYWDSVPPRRWYQPRARLPWRRLFPGVPAWVFPFAGLVVVYVWINFFASFTTLPGQPEAAGGLYWFDVHGRHVATDRSGYLAGLRAQMRIFTGLPMVFYGVAALATYGRRGSADAA